MKIITRYRLLMIFITVLLIVAGSLMAYENSLLPTPESSLGKIMISGGLQI